MEKISFRLSESEETVDFFVLEQTKISGVEYLLVSEEAFGDGTAYMLKNAAETEEEAVYVMVEDDSELEAVGKVFDQILEDVDLEL